MPLYPSWADIGLRLLLTVLAGALVGINRGVRGHAAGLMTTILVALVIGLCFGGGQLALGGCATGLTVFTLWGLVALDVRIPRDHRGLLCLKGEIGSFSAARLRQLLEPRGCKATLRKQSVCENSRQTCVCFELSWRQAEAAGPPLDLIELLNEHYDVISFELTSDNHV